MPGPHETNTQPTIEDFDLTDVPDASGQVVPHAALVLVSGAKAGARFALVGAETIIGRAENAHVRLDEPGVSGRHAQIVLHNGQHVLIDLNSTNGTFLNSTKLEAQQPAVLSPGDTVQVADTVLSYIAGSSLAVVEPTRQLSKISPALPDASMLRMPEAQLLAQILQSGPGADASSGPTLEEQIAKIQRFFAVIKRHWVALFACVALGAFAGIGTVFISPPVAEGAFRLRVSPPKPFGESYSPHDLDLFYASTEQNYTSPALVTATLTAVNKKPPARAQVAATIAGMKFETVGEALYRGVYSHKDPQYAVNFLKRHLEGFVSSEIQRSVHVAQTEVDFLTGRLKDAERDLAKNERELQEFKSKHLEGLPENASGHLTSREALITRRAELSAQVERTRLELDLARKQLKEEAPLLVKRGEGTELMERTLGDLKRQLSEARAKGLGEIHPQVVSLKKQIEDTERSIAAARASGSSDFDRSSNPGLVALRNRVGELEVAFKGAQAELGSIGSLVTRLDSIVGTMPEVEARYAELTRSYAATKDLHGKLFDRLRTSQLQLELERASARARYEVVSPPETSGLPLRRALMLKSIIGVVAGLAAFAAIVTFLELRRYVRTMRARRTNAIVVRSA